MAAGQLRQLFQSPASVDGTGGIIGGVDEYGSGAGRDGGGDGVHVQGKALLLPAGDQYRRGTSQFDHFNVADPARSGEEHLVSFTAQGQHRVAQRLLGTGAHGNLLWRVKCMVIRRQLVTDSLPQLRDAGDRGVFGALEGDSLYGGPADVLRGAEVRLSGIHGDNI